jgi:hypothetical protein
VRLRAAVTIWVLMLMSKPRRWTRRVHSRRTGTEDLRDSVVNRRKYRALGLFEGASRTPLDIACKVPRSLPKSLHERFLARYKPETEALTADFSEHDPSRMMHICGLDEGFV